MAKHDSIANAPTGSGNGVRWIILPRDYLQAQPTALSDWRWFKTTDGRTVLMIAERDLAQHVVDTIRQLRDQVGRVTDRRYEILRKLASPSEWAEAEGVVASVDTAVGLNGN